MALEVNPASPRVGLVPGFSFDDMSVSFLTFLGCKIGDGNVRRDGDVQKRNLSRKTIDQRLGSMTFVRFLFDTSLYRLRHLYRLRCSMSTDFSEQFRWQVIELNKETINKIYGIYCMLWQHYNWMRWQGSVNS